MKIRIGCGALTIGLLACSGEAPLETVDHVGENLFGETEPETLLQLYAGQHSVPIYNSTAQGSCSGTQVRQNYVLTARHCVTNDGTVNGPLTTLSNVLVGAPESQSLSTAFMTPAQCQASTSCTRGFALAAVPNRDWALIRLDESEPRSFDASSFYVPLNYSSLAGALFLAAYGRYSPTVPSVHDLALNYGDLQAVDSHATPGLAGVVGPVLSADAVNGTLVQGGDSGSGVWTGSTAPPGLVGITSAGYNDCDFGEEFCDSIEAAWVNGHPSETQPGAEPSNQPFSFIRTGDASMARDWDFESGSQEADFDFPVISPTATYNWQVSSGNLTQWDNSDQTIALAKTVMGDGCIATRVTTTDNDRSGIVFRYVNTNNFYVFWADDQNDRMRIVVRRGGNETVLASRSWTGTWAGGRRLMVCFQSNGGGVSGTVQAYMDYSISQSLTVQSSLIQGGRLGFYNDFNQGARHSSLETISLSQGEARLVP